MEATCFLRWQAPRWLVIPDRVPVNQLCSSFQWLFFFFFDRLQTSPTVIHGAIERKHAAACDPDMEHRNSTMTHRKLGKKKLYLTTQCRWVLQPFQQPQLIEKIPQLIDRRDLIAWIYGFLIVPLNIATNIRFLFFFKIQLRPFSHPGCMSGITTSCVFSAITSSAISSSLSHLCLCLSCLRPSHQLNVVFVLRAKLDAQIAGAQTHCAKS